MSAPRCIRFDLVNDLRDRAAQWNDLVDRSEDVLPTGRAELIVDWLKQFAPNSAFVAIAVEQDGQLVTALPLVARKLARVIAAGSLPCNPWCWAGDLLLDASADAVQTMRVLTAALRDVAWPLLWFDAVPLESPRWKCFLTALNEGGFDHVEHERFRMGQVGIVEQLDRNWDHYEQAWSGNHRRHMRKALRRADEAGGVEVDIRRPTSKLELELLLHEGFEVEHHSWKGHDGSSVLANPAMWEFYERQASRLMEWGNLELAFLRYRGRAIAFEYGWSAGGIYYTPKAGFDEDFAQFTPSQLLRYFVLKESFARRDRTAVDFLGPLCDATARWSTQSYPICRLLVETGRWQGRTLLHAYRHIIRPLRKSLERSQPAPTFKLVEVHSNAGSPLPNVVAEA